MDFDTPGLDGDIAGSQRKKELLLGCNGVSCFPFPLQLLANTRYTCPSLTACVEGAYGTAETQSAAHKPGTLVRARARLFSCARARAGPGNETPETRACFPATDGQGTFGAWHEQQNFRQSRPHELKFHSIYDGEEGLPGGDCAIPPTGQLRAVASSIFGHSRRRLIIRLFVALPCPLHRTHACILHGGARIEGAEGGWLVLETSGQRIGPFQAVLLPPKEKHRESPVSACRPLL